MEIICCVLFICVILAALTVLVLHLPQFGKRASKAKQQEYAKRASNYKDGKFVNIDPFPVMGGKVENYPPAVSTKGSVPKEALPHQVPQLSAHPEVRLFNVTWFGHSTLLLQMHGMHILFDPVFSNRTSPFSFFGGAQRFNTLPMTIEKLPEIDLVMITHDHYDHLDYATIRKLDKKVKQYIVPLGVENHLMRWGVKEEKVTTMAWWEKTSVNGLMITCTPASHFTRRSLRDGDATLWASWVLEDEYRRIFESGDTGYSSHFAQIVDHFDAFDLVLMDGAQYNSAWAKVHMTPEESVRAAKLLHAKRAMLVHWGAFCLAPHAWDDPIVRFSLEAQKQQLPILTPMIGQTFSLEHPEECTNPWWEEIA